MYSVEYVCFVADLLRFQQSGEVVGADDDAFGGGAAAFEDEGEVVEGEVSAADALSDGLAAGHFEGVVEPYHYLEGGC